MTRKELIELPEGTYKASTDKSKYQIKKFTDQTFGKYCVLECLDELDKTSVVLHPEKVPQMLKGESVVCAGKTIGNIGMTGEIYINHLKINQ